MQEEVTQKTVTFCIRATKITADLLKKVLVAYLRHQKQKSVEKKAQKNQPKQGKVTVKELAKQNAGMVNIEITNKNIKSFERYARKYGINYALKKDKSKEPPVYLVFFKGRDQDALNAAFREFYRFLLMMPQIRSKNLSQQVCCDFGSPNTERDRFLSYLFLHDFSLLSAI